MIVVSRGTAWRCPRTPLWAARRGRSRIGSSRTESRRRARPTYAGGAATGLVLEQESTAALNGDGKTMGLVRTIVFVSCGGAPPFRTPGRVRRGSSARRRSCRTRIPYRPPVSAHRRSSRAGPPATAIFFSCLRRRTRDGFRQTTRTANRRSRPGKHSRVERIEREDPEARRPHQSVVNASSRRWMRAHLRGLLVLGRATSKRLARRAVASREGGGSRKRQADSRDDATAATAPASRDRGAAATAGTTGAGAAVSTRPRAPGTHRDVACACLGPSAGSVAGPSPPWPGPRRDSASSRAPSDGCGPACRRRLALERRRPLRTRRARRAKGPHTLPRLSTARPLACSDSFRPRCENHPLRHSG